MPNPQDDFESLIHFAASELETAVYKGNLLTFVPYSDQLEYLQSQTPGRYCSGGNRAGKSDVQVVDAIWTANHCHPYRKNKPEWGTGPLQLRFVVVDVAKGVEQILLPKLRRWVPRSMCKDNDFFKSWDAKNLIFTFKNGSTIDVLTYGMTIDKHGGVPRHAIYFDEEPPREIFNENMMRLRDYAGWWSIAATPVNGITWTYDLLWEPAENGDLKFVSVHTLDPANNPYLMSDEEEVNQYTIGMEQEEKDIREHGKFVAKSGLVFPNFSKETHVLDQHFAPPKDWEWYSSVDVGWNNPTAWLWHAVAPDGRIYTFAEHYASRMTVAEHAQVVKERERGWGKTPEIRTGDPAMKQTSGITGTSYLIEYGRLGIGIGVEGIPHDVMIGVEKMQQYIQVHDLSPWGKDRPMWMISPNCANLIRELKRLRWATYDSSKMAYDKNKREEIHKKDDHASDSARYFMTMMPDLSPVLGTPAHVSAPRGTLSEVMDYIYKQSSESTSTWDTVDDEEYEA